MVRYTGRRINTFRPGWCRVISRFREHGGSVLVKLRPEVRTSSGMNTYCTTITLLECDNVQSGRHFPTTRRTLLFPSAGCDTILHSKRTYLRSGLPIRAPLLRTRFGFPSQISSHQTSYSISSWYNRPVRGRRTMRLGLSPPTKLGAGTKPHSGSHPFQRAFVWPEETPF